VYFAVLIGSCSKTSVFEQLYWKKARPAYTKIPKTDIHTKIDTDILTWLKCEGKGYQARLNAALRFAMNNGF
jgi:uncharacterized protein (DUF4415 family)